MKSKYSFEGYNILAPLKDNLAQLKNFLELVVSFLVVTSLPGAESFFNESYGPEVAIEFVAIITILETYIVYYIMSAVEYYLKGNE